MNFLIYNFIKFSYWLYPHVHSVTVIWLSTRLDSFTGFHKNSNHIEHITVFCFCCFFLFVLSFTEHLWEHRKDYIACHIEFNDKSPQQTYVSFQLSPVAPSMYVYMCVLSRGKLFFYSCLFTFILPPYYPVLLTCIFFHPRSFSLDF